MLDNDRRYYLAEIGAHYRTVGIPTPPKAMGLILDEVNKGGVFVEVEELGTTKARQILLPGPGDLPDDVTPVNEFMAYKDRNGDILYFSMYTGFDSSGQYQLLYVSCSECQDEITTPDEESEGAYYLDGLCPKCYFDLEWSRQKNVEHAKKLVAEHQTVPGIGSF